MNASLWLTVAACVGHLGLSVLAALRAPRNRLAIPLALYSASTVLWLLAGDVAFKLSHQPVWHWIDTIASPWTAVFALHIVVAFTGMARRLRGVLWSAYAYFATLSIVTASAFVSDWGRRFAGSTAWASILFVGAIATECIALPLLVRHLRRTPKFEERQRAWLLLLAFANAMILAAIELAPGIGVRLPDLTGIGSLLSTALVATVALRLRVFDREVSTSALAFAFGLGTATILAGVAAFQWFGRHGAWVAVSLAAIGAGAIAAARQILIDLHETRTRAERFTVLGRFASQMTHDLKNPLQAMRGAVDYLLEERRAGRSLDDKSEFLELLRQQVDRLASVVAKYDRVARIEPAPAGVDINDVVRGVLALQGFAAGGTVTLRTELDDGLPDVALDRDLVAAALENLVRNAFEAMTDGGEVTVRTALDPDEAGGRRILLEVRDTGPGMGPRTAERAFDDFFTTKASGSGLGLAFVRRVVEAHGGRVTLRTHEGVGTTFRLEFPCPAISTVG